MNHLARAGLLGAALLCAALALALPVCAQNPEPRETPRMTNEQRPTRTRVPLEDGAKIVAERNPILPGADPHAIVIDGQVWVYPTRGGERFFAFSSPDMRNWVQHGPILEFKDVGWIDDDGAPSHHAWAPALAAKGGRYYFYYAVGPQNPTPSRIGVAVAKSPKGPFKDSGKPLLTGGNGFEAIDPMVFTDARSKKSYLYAGGSAGAKLRIFELGKDMVSLAREVPVQTPEKFTEAPFVHERNGTYYLSYSHGSWQDASYSVHYATSDTPVGPWTYRGEILKSNARHHGPGHHSFIRHPKRDEWFIVYHRWNDRGAGSAYRGGRQTAVETMEHLPDGSIRPIVMTDAPPTFSLGK